MSTSVRDSARTRSGRASWPQAFGRLYRKDLEMMQFSVVLLGLLIVAWEIFLLTRLPVWPPGVPLALSVLPLTVLPVWLIWDAVQSYRAEWQTGTVFFLLAAPVPGWVIAAAKLVALMTGFTALALLTAGGGLAILATGRGLPPAAADLWQEVPQQSLAWMASVGALIYWLSGLGTAVVFQAASAASHLAFRWRFPALVAALVVAWWLLWRLGGVGHYLLGWLPDLPVPVLQVGPDGARVITDAIFLDSGPIVGWLAGLVLLFGVTGWLLQHVLEVA